MTKIKEKDDELILFNNNLYTREEIIEIEKKLKISNFQSQSIIEQINDYINGKMKDYECFYFGITPKIFKKNGAKYNKLIMNKDTIKKNLFFKDEAHNIYNFKISQIYEKLSKPLIVLRGSKPNTLVAIIDLTNEKGDYILVSLSLNSKENALEVTRISSIYGKKGINSYLNNHSNDILDYYDKKKTNLWLSTRGLSLTDNNTLDDIGVQFSKFLN